MSAALLPLGLGRASPLVVLAASSSSSSSSSSSHRRAHAAVLPASSSSSSSSFKRRLVAASFSSRGGASVTTTSAAGGGGGGGGGDGGGGGGGGSDGKGSERFRRAAIRESSMRAASNAPQLPPSDGGDDGKSSMGVSLEAQQIEMRLGRAAMLGFFFTTLGDVMTRGKGPLEQLRDEQRYVLNHINPVNLLKDALEVAGFYVEGVVIVWVCLAIVFLAAVQQGLANPTRTYVSKDRAAEAKGAQRVDAMLDSVKTAVNDTVREQKAYELFNGRLAMLGISAAFIGDKVTGGLGPLEQIRSETGVPVIDAELFGAFFLFGVFFNVVATVVTVTSRAWQKGKSL